MHSATPVRGTVPLYFFVAVATMLAAALVAAAPVLAQTTFAVSVQTKSAEHPYHGQGHPEGYVIDGEEGLELTLMRGQTYLFVMQDVPGIHPFYLSSSDAGAGAGQYTDGVTGGMATGTDTLTFVVPDDAPDSLYYQCGFHQYMGWKLRITSTATATEAEEVPEDLVLRGNYPNPFNPVTTVRFDLRQAASVYVEVYDVLGRLVLQVPARPFSGGTDHALQIDAGDLRSGVYVYRLLARANASHRVEVGTMTVLK